MRLQKKIKRFKNSEKLINENYALDQKNSFVSGNVGYEKNLTWLAACKMFIFAIFLEIIPKKLSVIDSSYLIKNVSVHSDIFV